MMNVLFEMLNLKRGSLILGVVVVLFGFLFLVKPVSAQVTPNPPVDRSTGGWDVEYNIWFYTVPPSPDGWSIYIWDDGPAGSYPLGQHWLQEQRYLDANGNGTIETGIDSVLVDSTGPPDTGFGVALESEYPPGKKVNSSIEWFYEPPGSGSAEFANGDKILLRFRACDGTVCSDWSETFFLGFDYTPPTSTIDKVCLDRIEGTGYDELGGFYREHITIQRASDSLYWNNSTKAWQASIVYMYGYPTEIVPGFNTWTRSLTTSPFSAADTYTIEGEAQDLVYWTANRNLEAPPQTFTFVYDGVTDPCPVPPPGDFTIFPIPTEITMNRTDSSSTTVTINWTGTWDDLTTMDLVKDESGLGSGMTTSFATASFTKGSATLHEIVLTINTSDTTPGDYPLPIQGTATPPLPGGPLSKFASPELIIHVREPPWIKTTSGDVGAKGMIDMNPSPDGPPEPNADYLAIADASIIDFTSAKGWLVKNYSGGIDTGFVSGDIYTELWEEFGRGRATDWPQSSNGDIPNNIGVYAYPSAEAINNGDTGPSQDFTWDGTGAASVDDSVVLFINGNLNIDSDLNLGSKKVVFVVKGDINVSAFSGSADWQVQNPTPGQFVGGSTSSIDQAGSWTGIDMVVHNGELYFGTYEWNNRGEVYKYNGTAFTKVSQATAGQIAAGGTINIDGVVSLTVHNGSLYAGTNERSFTTGGAEVYRCTTCDGTDWNAVTQAPGQITAGGTSDVNEVATLAAYNGSLYAGTSANSNKAEIYRCTTCDGTDWNAVTQAPGQITAGGTTDINGVLSLTVYNGSLYVGTSESGSTEIYRCTTCDGTDWNAVTQAPGQITAGGTTGIGGVMSMAVYNSSLYIGTASSGFTEIYRCTTCDGTDWNAVTQAPGQITAGGTTGINGVSSLTVYNASLYAGTQEGVFIGGGAEIYRYEGGTSWTKVSQPTPGIIASDGTTNIESISPMAVYNGSLYAGTATPDQAEVYKYSDIIPSLNTVDGFYVSNGKFKTAPTIADPPPLDCPGCQLTVNGAVIAFGGIDLFRDLGLSNINNPSETFNFDPSYLYLFTKVDFTLGYSLLGKRISSFTELTP